MSALRWPQIDAAANAMADCLTGLTHEESAVTIGMLTAAAANAAAETGIMTAEMFRSQVLKGDAAGKAAYRINGAPDHESQA